MNPKMVRKRFRSYRISPAGYQTLLLVLVMLFITLVAGCTLPQIPFSTGSAPGATAPTPWSGSWDSDYGTMVLTQSGNQVTGTYDHDGGRITGTVSGNTLTGTWSEAPSYKAPDDAGDFAFILAADGKSFSGGYRYGSGTGGWAGTWTATRI